MNPEYWLVWAPKGNVARDGKFVDGPHSSTEGVAKAAVLHSRIFGREVESFRVAILKPLPDLDGVEINEEAAEDCRQLLDRYTGRGPFQRGASA